jgi:hypothetical protein
VTQKKIKGQSAKGKGEMPDFERDHQKLFAVY